MKSKSFSGMKCSIASALELIGDRWSFLIIRDMSFGVRRYDDLRQGLGISPATLAAKLKHLEASGLITRHRYEERPPRDEYRLSDKGRDLWKVLFALREWGDRWDANGSGDVTIDMVDQETGGPLKLAIVDETSGLIVSPDKIALRAAGGADASTHRLLGFAKRPDVDVRGDVAGA